MSNVVRRLFGSRPAGYETASGVNHEGFPAFARSLEEQYIQTLLTNTLGHTFYASQGDNYAVTLDVHRRMMAADPQFAAQAIVYARERGTMRLQPIVGLVFLSMTDRKLFRAIFGRVIQTPGDLLDFVQIVRSKQIRPGMGRAVKQAINDWLNGLSEYHAIKYGSAAGAKFSLRDVLRLTHPQPLDETRNALFVYLTDREMWREAFKDRVSDLLPQIAAVEQLKRSDNPIKQRALIEVGRLPYEAVTGAVKPDREMWSFLMRQMPYFALLRHLNTLQRAGVFVDEREAGYVAERLSDLKALRKAKVLPFRLHAAWIAFDASSRAEKLIKAALERAIEGSFANLPQINGVVAIAPDVSGSMSGAIHHPSKVRYIDVAAIFAGALLRASQRSIVLPFEDRVVDVKLPHNLPLIEVVQRLASIGGGGTAVSAPVSKLLDERKAVDVFIGITDNVEWARDNYGGMGFLPTWRTYRKKVASHAQAFLITIAPYANAIAPQDEPGVHYIYGWADHVPAYIAQTLLGYAGQVEAVRGVQV